MIDEAETIHRDRDQRLCPICRRHTGNIHACSQVCWRDGRDDGPRAVLKRLSRRRIARLPSPRPKAAKPAKGRCTGRKNGSWEARRRNTKSSRSSSIPSPTGRLALPSARSRRTTWRPGSLKAPTPSRPTSRPGRINTAKARADLPHGRPDPGVRRRQNTASPTFRPMKCRIDWFDITRACATAACARRETTPCSCDPFGGIVSTVAAYSISWVYSPGPESQSETKPSSSPGFPAKSNTSSTRSDRSIRRFCVM
jgi:hypothetical protein